MPANHSADALPDKVSRPPVKLAALETRVVELLICLYSTGKLPGGAAAGPRFVNSAVIAAHPL